MRNTSGMKLISFNDIDGRTIVFPVDRFVHCWYEPNKESYIVQYLTHSSWENVTISEKVANDMATLVNGII